MQGRGISILYSSGKRWTSMRKGRNQKWICLILVIIVMISGICLEKIPANAYFSCKHTNTIAKADGILQEMSAYRLETLSQREVISSIRTAKRESRRTEIRLNHLLGFSLSDKKVLLQNFHSKKIGEEYGIFAKPSCSTAILSYIHNQDGEKA